MKGKKFYVTTAIDYSNDKPHIGHALQKVAADVLARWHRSLGEDVFFLTGTDEHGLKIQRAAEKAGKKPQEFVDELAKEFQAAWAALNLRYDVFYRTTNPKHKKLVQEFTKQVNKKGDIYKGNYEGYYCVGCENYVTEEDLEDGRCKIHQRPAEYLKEECYFFRLSKYQDKLLKLYEKNPRFVLPEARKNEVVNRVKAGLRDLSISRTSFRWGIPFPLDKKHITYVWFDALTNYITALGWPKGKLFKKFWPADAHLLGADNLWFHAVIWPAMLYSAGIEPPKTILINGWLTLEGQKISKSLGNVIEPRELAKEFGTDAVRYFLLRGAPYGLDLDFRRAALAERANTDLANNLGNLVSRTLTLLEKFSGGKIPEGRVDEELKNKFLQTLKLAQEKIENFEFHHALESIWGFISDVNRYVDAKKPWELAKQNRALELQDALYNLAESLRVISALVYPFIPETAEKIAKQLGLESPPKLEKIKFGELKPGAKINKGKILFEKIDFKPLDEFSKVDLRVAQITAVDDVEGSDNLYKLQIDLGLFGKRQIIAGVKKFYTKEQLFNKKIILLTNLKPAKIQGIESNGMLLAAEGAGKIEVLALEKSKPGDSVLAEGIEKKSVKEIDLDFFSKLDLEAKEGFVFYEGKKLKTDAEQIKSNVAGKVR